MQIVTLDELKKMPNGTLYCRYIPDMLNDDWNIIAGHYDAYEHYEAGFNCTLPLNPFHKMDKDDKVGFTNWCTTDTTACDYDKTDQFAVFSKTEIRAMITVLQYALADCNFDIYKFMYTWYYNDNEIDEKELGEWLEDAY